MAEIFNAKDKVKAAEIEVKHGLHERVSVKQLRTILAKTGSDGLFTCYATFPPDTHFESQELGEVVILFLRQHLITNLPWVLIVTLALSIPSVFSFFPPFAALPTNYQFVLMVMWYLFVSGYTLAKLMGWFFNIYLLTDERIVDIDFINVLFRKVSTAKIEEIQDVSIEASGTFQTLFNYGSIFIQTAAEVPEFDFVNIPKPDKVGTVISQMIDQEEQEKIEGRVK